MATVRPEDFVPPGPGVWRYDPTHFPRPMSRIAAEVLVPAGAQGHQAGGRRYGQFANPPRMAPVLRFRYTQAGPLIGRPAGDDEAAHAEFDRLLAASPEAQERIANAQRAFETRLWRDDIRRWDTEEKPAAVTRTRSLASVDPAALDMPGLAAHIAETLEHLASTMARHHSFNPA